MFLTRFIPILSFVGPGVTALTSGNIYKASAQYIINQRIEKETDLSLMPNCGAWAGQLIKSNVKELKMLKSIRMRESHGKATD